MKDCYDGGHVIGKSVSLFRKPDVRCIKCNAVPENPPTNIKIGERV